MSTSGNGARWTETKLEAGDEDCNYGLTGCLWDHFGNSVSASGERVVVGTQWSDDPEPDSGSAYVFEALSEPSFELALSGTCPGEMTAAVVTSANTEIELFQGASEGPSQVPPGPCGGTELAITGPSSIAFFETDTSGFGSVTLDLVAADCGEFLQSVNQDFCSASNVEQLDSCNPLVLGHSGEGRDPTASLPGSPGCDPGEYVPGEIVELTSSPASAWQVGGWSGTDDDTSTQQTNTVTMPGNAHAATVNYVSSCYALALTHSGSGADLLAVPLGDGSIWTRHVIDGSFNGAQSVYSADVDGDGDLDVLGAGFYASDITWWENAVGDGSVWTEHTIDGSFGGAASVYSADVDGDGDLDVLGAGFIASDITWWENTTGDGSVWTEHKVDGVDGAQSVYSADVDGDGDLDVLGAGFYGDDVTWWKNTAGDGSVWPKHAVDRSFDGAQSVYSADVDGDGDLDVLGAARDGGDITWWENTAGDGSVWTEHAVTGSFDGAQSVYSADVDGDGDLDVLGAAAFADDITWWENTGGDGSVWTEHTIDGSFASALSVYSADVDGDGDLDVLGAAWSGDDITWWENAVGDGSQWTEHAVAAGSFDGAASVYSADVDGDGDLDVLGAAAFADDITWWENVYGDTCPAGEFNVGDRIELTASPDPGWEVGGWSGTDDDASNDLVNIVTMPASDWVVAVDYVETAPSGPSLSVSGSCPGPVTITATASAPSNDLMLFAAPDEGTSYVANGPCSGTELDVAFNRYLLRLETDESGTASVDRNTSDPWCGRFLQAVERPSCTTTNVVQIPE